MALIAQLGRVAFIPTLMSLALLASISCYCLTGIIAVQFPQMLGLYVNFNYKFFGDRRLPAIAITLV